MLQFYHQKLANGLEIIAENLPFAQSLTLGFFVRCGARHETIKNAGISHFLEHMVFKGSESRSAQEVNRQFDALGITFNACTMEESTVFYATLLPEFMEECVEIYSDILRPRIRKEDFNAEKEVIIEEIKMYENEPPYCLDDRLRQTFFNGHPLGNSVLGNIKSVQRMRGEQLKGWIQEKYSPENVILCACGRVDFQKLVRVAGRYCGMWEKTSQAGGEMVSPAFEKPKLGFETFHISEATQQYFLACSASSVKSYRQRLVGRLVSSILGDDAGSRLYWELVDSGLAEHAVLGFTEFTDVGYFSTSLCCEPGTGVELWRRVERIYRDAEAGGITEKELSLAKNRIATACVLGSERAWNRIFTVGGDWTVDKEYHTVEEEVATLRTITLSEIFEFLKAYPLTQSLVYQICP